MNPPFGQLLRKHRRAKGLTLATLADHVGVTPGYLSMIENQRVSNPPSIKILIKLEAALSIHDSALCKAAQWQRTPEPIREKLKLAQQVANKAIDPPGITRVPLINKVAAGYPAGFTDLGYPARASDDVVMIPGYTGLHGGNDPDAFAATICGDSMTPEYAEGDIVVFSPLADVNNGCDCFARIEPDHESTFKRVYFDLDNDLIRLEALNPKYAPRIVEREQVAGLFRAVWRMSRIGMNNPRTPLP